MEKYRFGIPSGMHIMGVTDCALVEEGEEPLDMIIQTAIEGLGTEILVEIGDVTMFLDAWRYPEHWLDDWVEKLEVERDEVPDAIAALVAAAQEG